jgi:N-acetyl-anhydromuramyl-L-alanine amidase AmpD
MGFLFAFAALALAPLAVSEDQGNGCYPDSDWDAASTSNYTPADRENDYDIRWVVIHDIEGTAAGAISWFKNPSAQASAHYVIDGDPSKYPRPVCMVDDTDVAWHAGNLGYNRRAVGIEHYGWAAQNKYTDWEYDTSAKLTAWLLKTYNIPLQLETTLGPCDPSQGAGIIPHSAIPNPNDCSKGGGSSGHTDPGPYWDWTKYMDYVRKYYQGGPAYDAQHVGDSYPQTMESGRQYIVWSEFSNNGTSTWAPGGTNPTRLGTSGPQDRPSDFETPGNWMAFNRPTDVDKTTASGAVGRYTFIMTAPRVHNVNYVEKWALLQEGVQWFGPEISYSVTVVDTLPPFLAPSLADPPDGALKDSAEVAFSWQAADDNGSGVKEYDLVVSRSSDPADTGRYVATQTLNQSTLAWTVTGLPDADLHWWVLARDHGGNTAISQVWALKIDAQGPTAALPRSPADLSLVNTALVEFKWDAASDAGGIKEYAVTVSQSADVADKGKIVREERVDGATLQASIPGLPEGKLYWWVTAWDVSNKSSTSAVLGFTKDTTPPKVVETTPGSDAKVKEAPKVLVRLSEEIDPAQPAAGLLKLYGPDQKEIPGTVAIAGTDVAFTPGSPLAPGAYRASLSVDAKDQAGNRLGAAHEWGFTVESPGGGGAPDDPSASSLGRMVGPVPVWGWIVISLSIAMAVGVVLARRLRSKRQETATKPSAMVGKTTGENLGSPDPPVEYPAQGDQDPFAR